MRREIAVGGAFAMITDINNEDRLVQQTFECLHDVLGWKSVYAWSQKTLYSPLQ